MHQSKCKTFVTGDRRCRECSLGSSQQEICTTETHRSTANVEGANAALQEEAWLPPRPTLYERRLCGRSPPSSLAQLLVSHSEEGSPETEASQSLLPESIPTYCISPWAAGRPAADMNTARWRWKQRGNHGLPPPLEGAATSHHRSKAVVWCELLSPACPELNQWKQAPPQSWTLSFSFQSALVRPKENAAILLAALLTIELFYLIYVIIVLLPVYYILTTCF